MLKDVLDGLKMVADGIDSVTKIAAAVKSGQDYLQQKHPEVRADLKSMVSELESSMKFVRQASAVLTNFRFAITADAGGSDLMRFNNYFIQSKTETQHLRDHIDDLRTHCSRVREHANRIGGDVTPAGFARIFTYLGLNSPEREKELADTLAELAWEDSAVANSAQRMLNCVENSLKEVQNALGDGGAMYSRNVPAAAALLAKYGPHFERMEERAMQAISEIRQSAAALD